MKNVGRGGALGALLCMLAACGGSNSSNSSGSSSPSSTGPSSAAPQVALTSSNYSAAPASTAVVAIYRSGNSAGTATVGYTTVNGSALAGTDYTATSGSVSWSDGETAVKTVSVPVTSRAAGKHFAIALTSVEGQATFGSPTAATVAVAGTAGSSSPTSATNSSASASGTMIPSATQIVDSSHNVWTVSAGTVYEGGAAAGYSGNVALLLYYGGTIYQENKTCLWWSWNGSAWVSTSNPAPSLTPACASTTAAAPAASSSTVTPSGNFGIQVKGNHFVSSLDGSVLHLVGSNVSGLEGGAGNSPRVWGGFSGTTVAQWKTIASTWGINIIRLPINSYDWLNIVCVDPGSGNAHSAYSSNGNGTYTPDPKGIFRGIVAQTVANLTAAGLYVILDLHWDAPNNAAGQPQCPVGQPAFAGSDHALDFWSSIATTFQGNPAVMFELFNEPFGDGVYGHSVNNVAPGPDAFLMRDGGPLAPFHMQNNPAGNTDLILNHGGQAPVASKQAMINAIRATGATNVILDSPIWWAGEIETWLAAKPTDPLGQLAVAWHIYGYNKGPAPALNVLAKGYPIMITENEGFDAALNGGRSSNGYAWAAANDIGCLQWGWNNWGGASNLQALVRINPWSAGGAPLP